MSYSSALAFVLKSEGGYVNHPSDPGGATNKGITQAVFDHWLIAEGQSPRDVKSITDGEVEAIYRQNYWNVGHCDFLPDSVAFVHFDACVNHGPGRAAKLLQSALGVEQDGVLGPVTLSKVTQSNASQVANLYVDRRVEFYNSIVANKPSQSVFLKGWLNRMAALRQIFMT